MYAANCEYILQEITYKMNAAKSLFVLDFNERQSDSFKQCLVNSAA